MMTQETPLFTIEDRGNGYRFATCPAYPGFSVMLKPGELSLGDDHIRSLLMLVALDAVAAERERCAQIAEGLNGWGSARKGHERANELAAHIAKTIRGTHGEEVKR